MSKKCCKNECKPCCEMKCCCESNCGCENSCGCGNNSNSGGCGDIFSGLGSGVTPIIFLLIACGSGLLGCNSSYLIILVFLLCGGDSVSNLFGC